MQQKNFPKYHTLKVPIYLRSYTYWINKIKKYIAEQYQQYIRSKYEIANALVDAIIEYLNTCEKVIEQETERKEVERINERFNVINDLTHFLSVHFDNCPTKQIVNQVASKEEDQEAQFEKLRALLRQSMAAPKSAAEQMAEAKAKAHEAYRALLTYLQTVTARDMNEEDNYTVCKEAWHKMKADFFHRSRNLMLELRIGMQAPLLTFFGPLKPHSSLLLFPPQQRRDEPQAPPTPPPSRSASPSPASSRPETPGERSRAPSPRRHPVLDID